MCLRRCSLLLSRKIEVSGGEGLDESGDGIHRGVEEQISLFAGAWLGEPTVPVAEISSKLRTM